MKSNKVVFWIISSIIVAFGIVYVILGRNDFDLRVPLDQSSYKVFAQHIPENFDQLIYLRFDSNLQEIARETNNFIDDQSFAGMIETLESVIVFQGMHGSLPVSLIFFKGNDGFSIDQIETFGLLATGSEYEYIALNNNVWAYGDNTSLQWFEEYQGDMIENTPGWNAFTKELSSNHNAGFLSNSLSEDAGALGGGALVSQFSSLLEYTYVVSSIRKNKPEGKVVLQLADGTLQGPIRTLQPEILGELGESPLMYLEAENLLGLLSLDRNQLETMLPMLLGQRGTQQGIVFGNADTNRILNALEGNIGIIALPAPMSPLQLSVHIIFDDPEMFEILEKLTPLIESFAGPLLFGSGVSGFEKNTLSNRITYSLPLEGGDFFDDTQDTNIEEFPAVPSSLPIFSINRSESFASIDLFSIESALVTDNGHNNLIDGLSIADNTKILFGWDSGLMKDSVLGGLGVDSGDSLFSTGSLQGALSVHPNQQQIQIDFIVE